jgi:hypothetical protein
MIFIPTSVEIPFEKKHHITREDADKIVKLIGKIAQKNQYDFPQMSADDLFADPTGKLIWFDNLASKKIFEAKIKASLSNVWSYKKTSRILEFIRDDRISLSALCANEDNDYSEYSECILHLGQYKMLCPDKYGYPPIKKDKENIFIFCTTNTPNSEQHWNDYANKSTGARINIEFNFSGFENLLKTGTLPPYAYFSLVYGKVYYDSGYDFDFFKEVTERIQSTFGKSLTFQGSKKMAMLYKRKKYEWENESRLAIDLSPSFMDGNARDYFLKDLKDFFELDEEKHILFAKNHNPLFSWKIKNVCTGSNISEQDKEDLQKSCAEKGIPLTFC